MTEQVFSWVWYFLRSEKQGTKGKKDFHYFNQGETLIAGFPGQNEGVRFLLHIQVESQLYYPDDRIHWPLVESPGKKTIFKFLISE